jgi:hypothetical protein
MMLTPLLLRGHTLLEVEYDVPRYLRKSTVARFWEARRGNTHAS